MYSALVLAPPYSKILELHNNTFKTLHDLIIKIIRIKFTQNLENLLKREYMANIISLQIFPKNWKYLDTKIE